MQKIREQIGSAGLIVAIVALIAALTGGAYAATSSGGGKEASASAKQGPRGKQGKQGKPGKPGPAGPTGAAGQNGAPGKEGAAGKEGPQGKEGPEGKAGAGVEVTPIAPLTAKCSERGGAEVKAIGGPAGKEVCNGKDGPPGPQGEPWTAGGTLPAGETETGNWALNGTAANTKGVYIPISFPIPLAVEIAEDKVFYMTPEDVFFETEPSCPGNINKPAAVEGALCIYESSQFEVVNATFDNIFQAYSSENVGASTSGALLHFNAVSDGAYAAGVWAVTGPAPAP